MDDDSRLNGIIDSLKELLGDRSVPRNVKSKAEEAVKILKSSEEVSIKIDKVIFMLEDISNDNNIDQQTRVDILNILSCLEMII